MKKLFLFVFMIIFGITSAHAASILGISEKPRGVATPYWYNLSDGDPATYYLAAPTLSANDTAVGLAATQTLTNKTLTGATFTDLTFPAEVTTATNVLTAAEVGKVIWLNSATEFVTTLPAVSTTSAGDAFTFIIKAAPVGANYTVVTGNSLENVIYGIAVVDGDSVAGASEDTITFTASAAVAGDWAMVVSDGAGWYVRGQAVAATGITLTQAD